MTAARRARVVDSSRSDSGQTRDRLARCIEVFEAQTRPHRAAEASLAVGAPVKGTGGAAIGTIESIDAEFVTLKLTSGKSVRIPRSGIAGSAQGAVVGLTVADLQAQTSGDSASN